MQAVSGGSGGCYTMRAPPWRVPQRLPHAPDRGDPMYPHQAERLSEALEAGRLDALVATSPENVAYITGFRNAGGGTAEAAGFAVFTRAGTALVVPAAGSASVVADAVDV